MARLRRQDRVVIVERLLAAPQCDQCIAAIEPGVVVRRRERERLFVTRQRIIVASETGQGSTAIIVRRSAFGAPRQSVVERGKRLLVAPERLENDSIVDQSVGRTGPCRRARHRPGASLRLTGPAGAAARRTDAGHRNCPDRPQATHRRSARLHPAARADAAPAPAQRRRAPAEAAQSLHWSCLDHLEAISAAARYVAAMANTARDPSPRIRCSLNIGQHG